MSGVWSRRVPLGWGYSQPSNVSSAQPNLHKVITMALSNQLEEAIESASRARLQSVLRSICSDSKVASRLASKALLTHDDASASKKRKAGDEHSTLRYEMCIQCNEEFDTTTNDKYSCQWHEGKGREHTCDNNMC